jgi:hypothetical protein
MAVLAEDYMITIHNYVMFNKEDEKPEEMEEGEESEASKVTKIKEDDKSIK